MNKLTKIKKKRRREGVGNAISSVESRNKFYEICEKKIKVKRIRDTENEKKIVEYLSETVSWEGGGLLAYYVQEFWGSM